MTAFLQRRHFESVNCSDLHKVQQWLRIRGGQLNGDSYQMAGYLQAVASRTGRVRLAQMRTGSHWLGVETGRWQRVERQQRLCKRCGCGEVDDEAHMIWKCPALMDQRVAHSELFKTGIDSLASFFDQDQSKLASFLRQCRDECAAVEGWGRPEEAF